MIETDVLIVGAGPAGLATALALLRGAKEGAKPRVVVLDNLVSGVIAAGHDQRITICNREAKRILGVEHGNVLQQPVDLLPAHADWREGDLAHPALAYRVKAHLPGGEEVVLATLWIGADYTEDQVTFALLDEGAPALTVTVPRVRSESDPTRIETTSYSYLDGVAHATPLAMDMSSATVEPDDVRLTIGAGPIADELASLGLPTAPDFCTWGEHLSATFQLGTPL